MRRKVIERYRELARRNPAVYLPMLAHELWRRYRSLRNTDEGAALKALAEAVSICRKLAKKDQQWYPSLAFLLMEMSDALYKCGRIGEAIKYAEGGVKLYRHLAQKNPDGYNLTLARVLGELACDLYLDGRYSDALAKIDEAINLYRELTSTDKAYTVELATALNLRGLTLKRLERYEEAINSFYEALCLLEGLSEKLPEEGEILLRQVGENFAEVLKLKGEDGEIQGDGSKG